jgi:hypothetical protein
MAAHRRRIIVRIVLTLSNCILSNRPDMSLRTGTADVIDVSSAF